MTRITFSTIFRFHVASFLKSSNLEISLVKKHFFSKCVILHKKGYIPHVHCDIPRGDMAVSRGEGGLEVQTPPKSRFFIKVCGGSLCLPTMAVTQVTWVN